MRQQLPAEAPHPLVVRDIAQVVQPGDEFECALPVPGCLNLDAPAEEPASGTGTALDGPPGPAGTDDASPAGEASSSPGESRGARTRGNRR